ncbi:hypothetical protein BELL_0060g00010 [Botrytis elliptica]|uniref:Uncharacterized protein n=1 Tax=Botrytis elliptica TaxID=278938 RepID=A0A4Z1KBA7_9HELO|nr:hypothetical protein EAE99_001266 [Botrytis elliptica]TGO78607.1 hypothetical protein BELL_0060g00010 [Botrytis elliptica]
MHAHLGLALTLTPIIILSLIITIGRILNRKRFSNADTYDLEANSSDSEKDDDVTANNITTTTTAAMMPLRPARAALAPQRIQ